MFMFFLSVSHKHLLSATLDMHDMQENCRESNLQLVFFFQTIFLRRAFWENL